MIVGKLGKKIVGQPNVYRTSEYWRMNGSTAVFAGLFATPLLFVVSYVCLWMTAFDNEFAVWFAGICLYLLSMVLLFYPGNLVAFYPLAVEVEPSKRIVLIAPWKRLAIPVEHLRDIRSSFWHQGHVIRLCGRHGLLKSFIVPWFFGSESSDLLDAIYQNINGNA